MKADILAKGKTTTTKIDTTSGTTKPKESLGKTTVITSTGKGPEASKKDDPKKSNQGASLSKTLAPQASENKMQNGGTQIVRSKTAIRLHEAKKAKIANDVYAEILEETLMQTRKLLIDATTGNRVLRDEYNWQLRNNQRFEKALQKM